MNKGEENASESENDEDFCIEGENIESGSDDESGNNDSESEDFDSDDNSSEPTRNKKKRTISSNVFESESSVPRKTRQSNRIKNGIQNMVKDELESDEETDKSRSNALWAEFLSDVGSDNQIQHKPKSVEKLVELTDDNNIASKEKISAIHKPQSKNSTNAREYHEQPTATHSKCLPRESKRSLNGDGVGSLLNQLSKKKKLSVLETSQMDWKTFKTDEGINEELRTHNKGKDGYLERQDFLQRTDLRQFEIEKNLRLTRRKN